MFAKFLQCRTTWAGVINHIDSINSEEADEMSSTVSYMMSDGAEKALRTLVDGHGRPLFVPKT